MKRFYRWPVLFALATTWVLQPGIGELLVLSVLAAVWLLANYEPPEPPLDDESSWLDVWAGLS